LTVTLLNIDSKIERRQLTLQTHTHTHTERERERERERWIDR